MTERTYHSRITAMGTPFIATPHLVGSLHTVRPPMTEARRQHIYGKVQALRDEGHAQGMTPARYGIPLLIALFALAALWIVALSPASPPASPEANATTSVDGDGAGEGRVL